MKYIIVKPNCRELANHLWNYLSIYAYGLETGARVYNPSFFEWHQYFNLSKKDLFITKLFSAFPWLAPVWRMFGMLYGSYIVRVCASCVLLTLGIYQYLPPTRPLAENGGCETTYFIGWLFRNPLGMKRHREALIAAFTPKEHILKKIDGALAPLRGKKLIGVHLRQTPFKGFEDEPFLVPVPRVCRIVDEYLQDKKLKNENVALVIVSDEAVDPAAFAGFTTRVQLSNDMASLFLLSKCSVVIGSNSSFANLVAWFGNVPHIVTTNEPVDWAYYTNETAYFENKYATFAQ